MYNSQYYTCEQIDQRLLQGYVDDYNYANGTHLTKDQFLNELHKSFNQPDDPSGVKSGTVYMDGEHGTVSYLDYTWASEIHNLKAGDSLIIFPYDATSLEIGFAEVTEEGDVIEILLTGKNTFMASRDIRVSVGIQKDRYLGYYNYVIVKHDFRTGVDALINSNSVLFNSKQSLPEVQQAQARQNIGIKDADDHLDATSVNPVQNYVIRAAIENAKTSVRVPLEAQLNTKAEKSSVYTKGDIDSKESTINTQIAALDGSKANKATTLVGYGITDAYTKGDSNQVVDNKVTIEKNRASAAEQLLQDQYTALTQSDIVLGPLPTTGLARKIYRVPGTNSYSDYMYAADGDSNPILMATYNNATDANPTELSDNIATSGGVFTQNIQAGGDYMLERHIVPVNNQYAFTIPVKTGVIYKMTLPRLEYDNCALWCNVFDGNNTLCTIADYRVPIEHTEPEFSFFVLSNTGTLTVNIIGNTTTDVVVKMHAADAEVTRGGEGKVSGVFSVRGTVDSSGKVGIFGGVVSVTESVTTRYPILNDYTIGRYRFKILDSKSIRALRFAPDNGNYETLPYNINSEGIFELTDTYKENATSLRVYRSTEGSYDELDVCVVFYKIGNSQTLSDVAEKAVSPALNDNKAITSDAAYKILQKTGIGFTYSLTTNAGGSVDKSLDVRPNQLYKLSFPGIAYNSYTSRITIFDGDDNGAAIAQSRTTTVQEKYFIYLCSNTGKIVIRFFSDNQTNVDLIFEPVAIDSPSGTIPLRSFGAFANGNEKSGKFIYNTNFDGFTPGRYNFKVIGVGNVRMIRPVTADYTQYPALSYDKDGSGYIDITQKMINGNESEKVTSFRFYYKENVVGIDFYGYVVIFKGDDEDSNSVTNIFSLYKDEEYSSSIATLKKAKDGISPLVLMWFSDLHGNLDTLSGMVFWYNRYKSYIDDILNGGDTVTDSLVQYDDIMDDYFELVEDCPNLLVVGNHDVIGSQTIASGYRYWAALSQYSIKDIYDKFTAHMNYAAKGCVQPVNAAEKGYNFLYKDYNSDIEGATKLRLIVLDTAINPDAVTYYEEHYTEATSPDSTVKEDTSDYYDVQQQFLESTLDDARSRSIPVVIATHCLPEMEDFKMGNSFAAQGGTVIHPNSNEVLADDYLDKVQDFIEAGGEFICWLCGHKHYDRMGLTLNHNQLAIVINTANTRNSGNSIYNPTRLENSTTQYAFNHIAFDTVQKRVTLLRIGCDYDLYGRRKSMLVVDYENKRPFDELFDLLNEQ